MSCCCCVDAGGVLLDEIRRKEEEEEEEEEDSRGKMDVALLTEEYRSRRERQRRRAQVLLFRTGSEDLSEAVRIIPVAQGLTSPWEPNVSSPPPTTFESNPKIYDPWHVHLDLHRRSHPIISTNLPPLSPETMTSRCSWSLSSESRGRRHSISESLCSSRETFPCVSLTTEGEHVGADGSADSSGSSDRSSEGSVRTCSLGQAQTSPEQQVGEVPADSSFRMSTESPVTDSQGPDDPRSTSVTSCTTSQLPAPAPAPAPVPMFSRRLSAGAMCSSSQNHYPFPNRKTPRISEAARRLGMYSSF